MTCAQFKQPTMPPMYGLRILQDSGINSIQCHVRAGYSRPSASIVQAMARTDTLHIWNLSISLNGSLTLQPASGFFGNAVINISLIDSQGSISSFLVPLTVINVNAPPSISVLPSIQLIPMSVGPPMSSVGDIDDKWLRYSLTAASSISETWFTS